jgi:hypothetical protein
MLPPSPTHFWINSTRFSREKRGSARYLYVVCIYGTICLPIQKYFPPDRAVFSLKYLILILFYVVSRFMQKNSRFHGKIARYDVLKMKIVDISHRRYKPKKTYQMCKCSFQKYYLKVSKFLVTVIILLLHIFLLSFSRKPQKISVKKHFVYPTPENAICRIFLDSEMFRFLKYLPFLKPVLAL